MESTRREQRRLRRANLPPHGPRPSSRRFRSAAGESAPAPHPPARLTPQPDEQPAADPNDWGDYWVAVNW